MNIGVIGAGKFGIAIANQLSLNKKNKVIVLSRSSKKVNSINSHQKVEFYTNNLSKNVIGISSFLIFCTLPFTYRMLLNQWEDVYCLLFIYLAFLLFYFSKKRLGLIVLIYGLTLLLKLLPI